MRKIKAKELTEAHYLAGVAKLVDDQLLAFYTSLYLMGVNGLSVNVRDRPGEKSPAQRSCSPSEYEGSRRRKDDRGES